MQHLWLIIEPNLHLFAKGFMLTMMACALAIIGSVLIGILVASLKTSPISGLRKLGSAYTELFRNVPFVVQLFFFFYGLPELGFYIGAFETGVLALSIVGGAFVADTIRSGILSIDRGIIESAEVFGLSRFEIFKSILLPIALRVSVRPMGAVLVNLILTSSILSTIPVNELTGVSKIVAAETFRPFEVYFLLLVLYAALTFLVSQMVEFIHRRLNRYLVD
jgi:polar amino acid transport system permease protein/putative glutamine transport system permease protein